MIQDHTKPIDFGQPRPFLTVGERIKEIKRWCDDCGRKLRQDICPCQQQGDEKDSGKRNT